MEELRSGEQAKAACGACYFSLSVTCGLPNLSHFPLLPLSSSLLGSSSFLPSHWYDLWEDREFKLLDFFTQTPEGPESQLQRWPMACTVRLPSLNPAHTLTSSCTFSHKHTLHTVGTHFLIQALTPIPVQFIHQNTHIHSLLSPSSTRPISKATYCSQTYSEQSQNCMLVFRVEAQWHSDCFLSSMTWSAMWFPLAPKGSLRLAAL